eukprot:6192399-Pleurochrysis_carterae.AAC.1
MQDCAIVFGDIDARCVRDYASPALSSTLQDQNRTPGKHVPPTLLPALSQIKQPASSMKTARSPGPLVRSQVREAVSAACAASTSERGQIEPSLRLMQFKCTEQTAPFVRCILTR